jgi:hypothetical protein
MLQNILSASWYWKLNGEDIATVPCARNKNVGLFPNLLNGICISTYSKHIHYSSGEVRDYLS